MFHRQFITALIVAAAVAVASGCAGSAARDKVLLPAVSAAWVSNGVADDIDLGIATAVAEGDITPEQADGWWAVLASVGDAIEAGDRVQTSAIVIANWDAFRQFAERGVWARVQSGQLSDVDLDEDGVPDLAESYMERLDNFEEASGVLGEQAGN